MKPTKNKVILNTKDGVIVVKNEADGFSPTFWLFAPFIPGSLAFGTIDAALDAVETHKRNNPKG